MLRPFSSSPSHVKKESRKPSFRFDDLFSDEEDCVLSSPPLKRVAITPPVALSGVETYWLAEEPDSVSLLVLRNPNARCTVTCPSQDTISLAWSCGVPPVEVLSLLGGGLRMAYQAVHEKSGTILLHVKEGHVQQNQSLWNIQVLKEHAVFVIPKVSAITASTSEC